MAVRINKEHNISPNGLQKVVTDKNVMKLEVRFLLIFILESNKKKVMRDFLNKLAMPKKQFFFLFGLDIAPLDSPMRFFIFTKFKSKT